MHAIQHRQHVLSGGLHTQRHPGEPGRPQLLEELRRRGFRIGLRRHLGVFGQREIARGRRRAPRASPVPPSSDGVPPPTNTVSTGGARPAAARQGQLGPQGFQPPVRVRAAQLGGCVGVEVAVAAAGGAERHVNVDAERSARSARPGREAPPEPFGLSYAQSPRARTFAHRERKSRPVRAVAASSWHNWGRDCRPFPPPHRAGGSAARRLQARLYLLLSALMRRPSPPVLSAGRRICAAGQPPGDTRDPRLHKGANTR